MILINELPHIRGDISSHDIKLSASVRVASVNPALLGYMRARRHNTFSLLHAEAGNHRFFRSARLAVVARFCVSADKIPWS
jgi:hypothetical protein